jgi:calcineurin-like phosphoesterase family protein
MDQQHAGRELGASRPRQRRPRENDRAMESSKTGAMATFFTSDHHFGHANIIRYCGRPYGSVGEMNFDLTRRWNEVVAPGDHVWYLGDFAMGDRTAWPAYVAGLNGRITLVRGNHDADPRTMRAAGFAEVSENLVVEVDGKKLWLNHFPPAATDGADYKGRRGYVRPQAPAAYDVALCGHVHEKWTVENATVNVGVDRWDFRPISLSQIEAVLRDIA